MAKGNKTGGREQGTPNKITKILKQKIVDILESEMDNIPILLNGLKDKEKLEILIKLFPYVLPKESTINLIEPTTYPSLESLGLSKTDIDIIEKLTN